MKKLLVRGWRPLLALLLLLLLWELAVITTEIEEWLLPSPLQIVNEGISEWSRFYPHLLSTIQLSLTGYLIGVSIGILTAVILHLVPFVRESVYPLLILTQNIPTIVLAPLLVIWFGFGALPKIIVITLVCFFPITIAALDGFRQVTPELKQYMYMAGATKTQLFWKLEFPFSLPSIFSGLKISATYSIMGAVISEWLGAESGIGVYMTLASSSFHTDRVFMAIFWIMVLSLLFFFVIKLSEKLVVRWQYKGEIAK